MKIRVLGTILATLLVTPAIWAQAGAAPSQGGFDFINAIGLVSLNRAVAIAEIRGPAEALAAIEPLATALKHYYLLPAVRGHLLMKLGRMREAASSFESALACRCSKPERRHLERKLSECFAVAR